MPAAALEQNRVQPAVVAAMARMALGGDPRGRRVSLLGLAFKPETDDVRETRALPIYRQLVGWGAEVVCHDPEAGPNFETLLAEEGLAPPLIVSELDDALRGAELLIVQTEWEEYRRLRPERLVSLMARPVVVDARRALDPVLMERGGVTYLGVGYPSRR
jgi:UDPglucose 6-dehydrogenase